MTQSTYKKPSAFVRGFRRYKYLYLMLVFPFAVYLVFRYAPLSGLQVAFKDYNIFKGMWQSPWAGFKYFNEVFSNTKFWLALKNTVLLNLWDLIFGFPVPIILAIMLYEMRSLVWKRISQTILYLPHFLSWIIIGGLVTQMFSSTGMINSLIKRLGGTPVKFLMDEHNWVVMYVAVGIWQSAGWGTIIFMATLTGIDPGIYEAASIDGAGRWKKMWYITLPALANTIVTVLVLNLAKIMNLFESVFVLQNAAVYKTSQVLQTYVYYQTFNAGARVNYGYTTAIGLFRSLVGMVLVLICNQVSKKIRGRGIV